VKKLNKKFKIFRVIIILCNHQLILLKLLWAIKGFNKIGLQLYNL